MPGSQTSSGMREELMFVRGIYRPSLHTFRITEHMTNARVEKGIIQYTMPQNVCLPSLPNFKTPMPLKLQWLSHELTSQELTSTPDTLHNVMKKSHCRG
ncbi:hypothetical protein AVEN_31206-1 [Araneus ventricosus]|uniref:Uncharacterized protein n=1 Tax=Araneus ventricosus TaxID=182803 RepID=A0A4Y2J602_ARAVE|nr:hypothetical protein AVEN_31206-1 [Araneus ventricosus]